MPTSHLQARAMVARQRVQACLFAHAAAIVPEQKRAVEEDVARVLGDVLEDDGEAQYAAVRRVFEASLLQVPAGQTPQKAAQSCAQIQKSLSKTPRLAEIYRLAAGHLALASRPPAAAPAIVTPPATALPRTFEIALPSATECFGVAEKQIFVAMHLGVETFCAATGRSMTTTTLPFTPTLIAVGGGTAAFFDNKTYQLATMRLGPSGVRPSTLLVNKCYARTEQMSCWGNTVARASGTHVQVYHSDPGLKFKFSIFAHKKGVHKLAVGETEILTATKLGNHMRFWSTRAAPLHIPWCTDLSDGEMRWSPNSITAFGRDFYLRQPDGVWKFALQGMHTKYVGSETPGTSPGAMAISDDTILLASGNKLRKWNRHNPTEMPTETELPDEGVEDLRCIDGGFVTRAADKPTLRVHRF